MASGAASRIGGGIRQLYQRARAVFGRRRKQQLAEELQFHLEMSARSIQAHTGISAQEARRQAMVDFGGLEQTREETYRQRPGWFFETLLQDAKYALRGFWRNKAFTLTILVTLALGIGATTAVFSVVDRILFRSLPYADADRLVSIGLVQSLEAQEFMVGSFFYDWRDNQKPFASMAAQGTNPYACSLIDANAVQENCVSFQAGFLPLFGISPILGRTFLPEEDRPGGPKVALISYALWQSRFGSDRGVLNRLIDVDGTSTRVVGVLPREFEMPTLQQAAIFLPMALVPPGQQVGQNGGIGQPMRTFARLKPGVSLAQARAEMEPLYRHTQETLIPAQIRKDFHLSIRSLRDRQTADAKLVAWILLGSALAVLLIACANGASLMMARGAAREREMAVRAALGASRGRLVRQTLTEAGLLALAGGLAGLGLAAGLLRIFVSLAPTSVPFLDKAKLDLRIAGFTFALAVVSGLAFGLVAAWQRPRAIASGAGRQWLGSRLGSARGNALLRRLMVAGQIAISVILLSGAALLLMSFRNLQQQKLGMEPGGVFTVRLALPDFHDTPVAGMVSRKGPKQAGIFAQAEAAVRALPGIRAVGWSESVPPGGGFQDARRFSDFATDGEAPPVPGTGGSVRFRGVTPDYFRALRIPIVRGTNFTEQERDSPLRWLILSRRAASRMLPGKDPIGQCIRMGSDGTWLTVVGVAEDVRNGGISDPDLPEVYWLRRNIPTDWGAPEPMMVVATDLPPELAIAQIQTRLTQLAPMIPLKMETVAQQLHKLADRPRFETALLGFFALIGLVMAVLGLYGLTAYLAAQRTQEIGIRMALGASRSHVLRLIAREGILLIVAGGAVGLAVALSLSRVLHSLLFGVGAHDPWAFAGTFVLLAVVALVATLIPARAAMRVDPVEALRSE
jgi:putative ABC transport system permease protein